MEYPHCQPGVRSRWGCLGHRTNSTSWHGVATHYTPRRLVRTSGLARHLLQPVCVYSPVTKYVPDKRHQLLSDKLLVLRTETPDASPSPSVIRFTQSSTP
jgi:hypothetical protein